ncbi:hypothetical protein OOZ15_10230 [Galbibacter sp. EGI 63066]|uniref:hypothetical protein n=1 Tax=Galbibacter sp. EGI 63066 TaxID=2993559 RepID=UPI002248CF0D|nr:hypothetical protein [Galbibacter sp. EGI 63066]MCX2680317.1 hypothetical protein [Galbibacter sp. EGI 63066]
MSTKFLNDSSCCKDGTNDQPEPQDCLDKWKEQLDDVCNQYNETAAETSKYKEEYTNSQAWYKKLENWNTIIKDTDEKANQIVTELEFFLEQVKIVCENSECTTEALEQLTCLVKTIFDCLYTYKQGEEGLKDKIKDFKEAIECLSNIDEEDKAEVMKCIEDYEQKITLVCEMQDAILSKLLETLKCAHLLHAYICGDDGLMSKLEGILVDFNGVEEDEDEDCDPEEEQEEQDDDTDQYPCNDKKAKPKPKFPINESDYYKEIEEALEAAKEKTTELEEQWIESKKISDGMLSQKNSLKDAIETAEAAESGK